MLKRLAIAAVLQILLGASLSVVAFAQLAPSASEIDQSVTAALRDLYSHNEAAKALGVKAKAVLVFPDIKKAAFIVGAQYGFGALRRGSQTVVSGALRAERTPHSARSFCLSENVGKMYRLPGGEGGI